MEKGAQKQKKNGMRKKRDRVDERGRKKKKNKRPWSEMATHPRVKGVQKEIGRICRGFRESAIEEEGENQSGKKKGAERPSSRICRKNRSNRASRK